MADTLVEGVNLTLTPLGGSASPTVDYTATGQGGTASWGIVGQVLPYSTSAELYDAFGFQSVTAAGVLSQYDLVAYCTDFLNTAGMDGVNQPMNGYGVRFTDGTDTAAVLSVNDVAVTPGLLASLTARCTGSRANGATYSLSLSYGTTAAAPKYDLTITMPYGMTQTWQGINATLAGAPSAPTFVASLVAAVNNGLGSTGPSLYFVATPSGAIGAAMPVVDTFIAPSTLGTDGATTITAAIITGIDTVSARTGMQAFKGSGVFQFGIAGLIDPTADAAMASLAQGEKSLAVTDVPSGTSTLSAVSAVYLPTPSVFLAKCMDWLRVDSSGKLHQPSAAVLGIMAQTPPWVSISNKPRTGLATVVSTEKSANPLSYGEKKQRQGAGLLYITNDMPRKGKFWGLAHGRNTSGTTFQDDVQYTRTVNWLELKILGLLGGLIGENQGDQQDDDLRRTATASVNSMLDNMVLQKQIVAAKATDDLTNNTAGSIALGYNYMAIRVKTFVGVRDFFVGLAAGGNVIITSAPAA